MSSMTAPTDRQRELRAEIADALQAALNAYNADDKDGTMPNFHFQLGAVVGLTQMLYSANQR